MPSSPLIIGIETIHLTEQDKSNLMHPLVSGVILFTRNYQNPQQLRDLCSDIKQLKTPELLICVDQEGGRVQRFKDGFTRLPPLAVYGEMAADDLDRAQDYSYRHGRVMAAELRAHGVDLSFAPVLDVQSDSTVIGDRAFSADTDTINALAQAHIAGMRDAGMAAVGKHFPGHGSVQADTHTELVTDHRELHDIKNYDLRPFVALQDQLQGIMMAHVCYPCLTDSPAGYAQEWVQTILRQELGFNGAVISDDLDMLGGAAIGDLQVRLQASLDAGCDLALVCKAASATQLLALIDKEIDTKSANSSARQHTDQNVKALKPNSPALSLEEMIMVGEWRQWQKSLQALVLSQ